MIQELVKAFLLIFMAEMGDKTQILAMAFATKYKVQQVLLGVFIGSLLNHGIAVILGMYMSSIIPLDIVRFIAACAFIIFGLWTLKGGEDEEEEDSKDKYGPVVTVALAFFIGELGDKTQLAAITLSTTAQYPAFILIGTVLGMLATSGMGIFVGSKLGKRVPELAIKIVSGLIFIFFGSVALLEVVPPQYITIFNNTAFFAILLISIWLLLRPSLKTVKRGRVSVYKKTAEELYEHVHKVRQAVENICLGKIKCGKCAGRKCMIGFLKETMKNIDEQGICIYPEKWDDIAQTVKKEYDMDSVAEGLAVSIIVSQRFNKSGEHDFIANRARETFEVIALGRKLPFGGDTKKYFSLLLKKNKDVGQKAIDKYNELT
ncbi:TMEM165/GDT1 family protein [Petroclostridium sp. X23]|uniref:TMEM165/GDT1 family protein n=1 Tax=Petroclostridium sp. X23 TaxID=3045146 RepID=UPI0024ADDFDC|nr:TMEM165/GDT1 family protein [Petroclostridium sp. X23]WHH61287.1 TMEM165/GDT1 family protein [Petroclostridium sp. X23]